MLNIFKMHGIILWSGYIYPEGSAMSELGNEHLKEIAMQDRRDNEHVT